VAATMDRLLSGHTMVLHHDEAGSEITTINDLMRRKAASRVAQRYGRLYIMQLIRWLSATIAEIAHKGGYQDRTVALFGLDEPFQIFRNEDRYLLGRKTWSIYRR
jgi:hypothetical protein